VAAQLKQDLGIDTELVVGDSREFTVWLDGKKLIGKERGQFPEPSAVVAAVRAQQPA